MATTNCLIINLKRRVDLWENLNDFINEWTKCGNIVQRIEATDYTNQTNVITDLIKTDRIDLNGSGFRNNKYAFLGELGCYMSHYNSWKYVIDNNLDSCLILEDGINFLSTDYKNVKICKDLDILFINEEMKMYNNRFIGYGTQGYIVTYKGAMKLLNNCSKLTMPIDLQIRYLCNSKILNGYTLDNPYVKRNNNRISSIQGNREDDTINSTSPQCPLSIIQRILNNMLINNVNLDDLI